MKIEETIVVEGRDDTCAIKNAVDAATIETHGFGIRPETWELIEQAHSRTGIIVFTDPDHAGEQIRRRILERFPDAKEAFLDRDEAEKDGDIGIENAGPDSIIAALEKAHCTAADDDWESYTPTDLDTWGLAGGDGAAKRRRALCTKLGIGNANCKTLLQRLNKFRISREEIESALEEK